MRILALDSSTAACSVAIWDGDRVIASEYAEMARGQSEHLVPMIDTALRASAAKVGDMDMIAVTTGPGAFTGVRIGLSTARGLAMAADRPLLGVSTLDVLAHAVPDDDRKNLGVLALVDSKRGDVFSQRFDTQLHAFGDPVALAPDHIIDHWALTSADRIALCGDAANMSAADRPHTKVTSSVHPSAETLARIAAKRGKPAPEDSLPSPVYLRPPDVKIQAGGGRLRP